MNIENRDPRRTQSNDRWMSEYRLWDVYDDFVSALLKWRIWTSLAWQEFRSTYRRSLIGVLWVTISFSGIVLIKIVIFSSLLSGNSDPKYNYYLLLGFFIWAFLAQSITSAPSSFTSATGWIRSEPLPYFLYLFKSVAREVMNLALTGIVVAITTFYLQPTLSMAALLCIPALLFLMLNAVFIKLLLGLLSARIRDITHLVAAIMTPLMFLSPIFWMPEQMGPLMRFLWWNPLYHYIEIFRAPIIDSRFPAESWLFSLTLFTVVFLSGVILFSRFRRRLVFWF
jgi:homopolymeric O-antigen transport system permease protein